MKGGSVTGKKRHDASRFQLIASCKHDLIESRASNSEECMPSAEGTQVRNCPFCRLVQKETDSWIQWQELQRVTNRKESLRRGIKLRRRLLTNWACNQLTNLEKHPTCPPFIEIALCGQLSKSITSLTEIPSNKEMYDLIQYRERVATVGKYAATFLQSRVRKYLCQRRVRKYILQRFEFTPSNRAVPVDSFFDSKTGKRLHNIPYLLKKERASSPRTIQRRLAAEEMKRRARYRTYVETLPRSDPMECGQNDHFFDKLNLISHFRQIFVFKDVVMNAMSTLKLFVGAEEWISSNMFSNELHSSSNCMHYIPCCVSFSQPAPSPYNIAIATALRTTPFTSLLKEEGLIFGTPQFDEVVNLRLRAMDEIAYDTMRCDDPDDVLHQCFSEEMHPVFRSMEMIAADPRIWNNRLDEVGYLNFRRSGERDNVSSSSDNESSCRPRFLPLTIRLHPFDTRKGFFCQFRLFFYKGKLAAACQVSKYSFHREIWEKKDLVMSSIISFGTSVSVKSFVKCVSNGSDQNANHVVGRIQDDPDCDVHMSTKKRGGCASIYLPDEMDVFSSPATFQERSLSYDDYMSYGGAPGKSPLYPFLNRLSSWQKVYKKMRKMGKSTLLPTHNYLHDEANGVQENCKEAESNQRRFCAEVRASLLGVAIEDSTRSGKIDSHWGDKVNEASKYIKTLEKFVFSNNLSMKQRIIPEKYQDGDCDYVSQFKSDDNSTHQVNREERNLVALEVFLDMPRIMLQKPDDSETQRTTSRCTSPMEPFSQPVYGRNNQLDISISRVVGAFSAVGNDVPHGLDIGAFEWSFFQQLNTDTTYQVEEKSIPAIERDQGDDFCDDTGMLTAQRKLGARIICFKLRGRGYQGLSEQERLPRRVKDFIGLRDEEYFRDVLNSGEND